MGISKKILATSADPKPEHNYNLVLDHPAVFKVRRYVGHHAQRPLSSQSIADRIQSQLSRRRRLPDPDPSTRLFPSNGPQAHNQGAYYLLNDCLRVQPGIPCELAHHRLAPWEALATDLRRSPPSDNSH